MNLGSRVLLILLGIGLGARLLEPLGALVGGLLGGLLAFGATEFSLLHARLGALDQELERLRQERVGRPASVKTAASAAPEPLPWREFEGPPARENTSERDADARTAERDVANDRDAPKDRDARPAAAPVAPPPVDAQSPTDFAPARWLLEFFTGGNTVVRLGAVILFFGVAFLLRYLAEHTHVPIAWRLCGIVLGAVALLAVGWRLRVSRPGYALALQGAGVGILYLTVFAALRLYALLPAAIALPILALIAVASALLAVRQDALSLALLGVIGGFLAPVLASTGEGSHVVLFSYYALLDAGILAMAWFKAWRPLNLVGFVFTFGVATAWGVLRYRPEAFASTEPFLVLYFLFYLAIAVLFTRRQPPQLNGIIDGSLVFGTPIAVFLLQSALLADRPMPVASSALVMSAVYLGLAWLIQRGRATAQALLAEAFLAIGVTLLTMAVPVACDARWNLAAWAVEGTALIWVGCRQRRLLARLAGMLLIFACGVLAATQFELSPGAASLPLADYAGCVLLSLAALVAACLLHRHERVLRGFERPMAAALFWWGVGWWSAGSLSQIVQRWPHQTLAGALLLLSCTTLACSELNRRTELASARIAALLQLPAMLFAALLAVNSVAHPAAAGGWFAWPLALLALFGLMARHEGPARAALANVLHTGATWLWCALASWELVFQIDRAVGGSEAWAAPGWVSLPLLLLGLLPRLVTRVAWPFVRHRDAYLFLVGVGIALYLAGWSVITNLGATGDVAPLPYYPLLNPLDLTQACVLLGLLRYARFLRAVRSPGWARIDRRLPIPALAALSFLWLNAALLRTLHQWFAVPYGFEALLNSTLVQTSLSIFWALLAFSLMLVATRRQRRTVWLVGATLLGVVIAKLFFVDLSRVGSIERIVSFVGVGLVMLVIGFVSPLPPPRANPEANAR